MPAACQFQESLTVRIILSCLWSLRKARLCTRNIELLHTCTSPLHIVTMRNTAVIAAVAALASAVVGAPAIPATPIPPRPCDDCFTVGPKPSFIYPAPPSALPSEVYTLDRRGYRNDFKGPGFMWPYCYETTPAGTAEPTGTAGAGSEDLPTPAGGERVPCFPVPRPQPVVTPVSNQ
ncbi:hypothetical protein PCL_12258 [Purpureocillium lilacinum]|uniref:Uncharacterized protein n=1 Tax=Purpureocillium lilacinum TaxID=33203 RepID=A0A2U3E8Q7_PURLI|nr:hypothetical protein PCL_12258 [Purpureocillium lilacinum]